MSSMNRIDYLDYEEYLSMMERLVQETYQTLDDLAKVHNTKEDKFEVIENLLLRSAGLLECVFLTASRGYQRNALALYRMLIERAFYLLQIVQDSQYSEFKLWSIAKQYRSLDQLYGLNETRAKITPDWIRQSKHMQSERRRQFGNKAPEDPSRYWTEPHLAQLARDRGLLELYLIAYAGPSSSAVHPTHDEGKEPNSDLMLIYHNAIAAFVWAVAIGLQPFTVVLHCLPEITERLITISPYDGNDPEIKQHVEAIRQLWRLHNERTTPR